MKYKEIVEKGLLHKTHWLHSGKFSDEDIEVIDREETVDFRGNWQGGLFRDSVISNGSITNGEIKRSQINKCIIVSDSNVPVKIHKCTVIESTISYDIEVNETVILNSEIIYGEFKKVMVKDSQIYGGVIQGDLDNCTIHGGKIEGKVKNSVLLGGRIENSVVEDTELREGIVASGCVLKNCEVVDAIIHDDVKKE